MTLPILALTCLLLTPPAPAVASFDPRDTARLQSQDPRAPHPSAAGSAQERISKWGELPRGLAAGLLEKYGEPDEMTPGWLTWRRRGIFLWMTVYSGEGFPRRWGLLEQSVAYPLSKPGQADVAALRLGVDYDPSVGTLTVSAESEEAAFLALNVAHDVLQGRRVPAEAREFYRKTMDLSLSGKSSPYTSGLLFKPPRGKTERRPSWLWFPMP